jgi:hypothetical protein
MKRPDFSVRHPLLAKLRQADRKAACQFPSTFDSGMGCVGLKMHNRLDMGRYDWFTPGNCITFAHTGGDGTHFSLLLQDGSVTEQSPVVLSVPASGFLNCVIGENLHDFLCLGCHRGFFALEQLAYHWELTAEVYTNPDWKPTESWHHSVGYCLGENYRTAFVAGEGAVTVEAPQVLDYLAKEFTLRQWADPSRFKMLQERYEKCLADPDESL